MYGGRGTPLGNAYSIHTGEHTTEDSMRLFAYDFSKKVVLDKEYRAYILSLSGKKIGCSCKKTKSSSIEFARDITVCHVEIICNFINSINGIE